MSNARQKWAEANAAVKAIEAERNALLEPTEERYRAAREALDEIEDELGEFIGKCISCEAPIFDGDPYEADISGDILYCKNDAHTWADFQQHPDGFVDADETCYTAETAKPVIDEHLAAGGSLDEPFCLLQPIRKRGADNE